MRHPLVPLNCWQNFTPFFGAVALCTMKIDDFRTQSTGTYLTDDKIINQLEFQGKFGFWLQTDKQTLQNFIIRCKQMVMILFPVWAGIKNEESKTWNSKSLIPFISWLDFSLLQWFTVGAYLPCLCLSIENIWKKNIFISYAS